MNCPRELPARPRLKQFEARAEELIRAFEAGDAGAMRRVRRYHPRLPGRPDTNDRNNVSHSALRRLRLSVADAQFIVARQHQFENWEQFAKHIEALNQKGSPVRGSKRR